MDQGASLVLITKYCGPHIKGPQWQKQQEERDRRTEILAHMVLGDRVSERTVEQFRAAGQQQGFVDVSGRRRMREVDTGDQDEELEQPLVRARTAPAASSEIPQLEQRSLVTGIDVGRTTSTEGEGESQ